MPPKKETPKKKTGSMSKPKEEVEGKEKKRKETEAFPFKDLKAFLEWFWDDRNGNDLVRSLNQYAQEEGLEDRIRREKGSPTVYAIVLNVDNDGVFSLKDDKGVQWKLCKVGFTQISTKKGAGNRMEDIIKQINRKFKSGVAEVLFALSIGAVDTSSFRDTEARIRAKVGKPVLRAKAKELGLPVHTEWVLTTQQHIDCITRNIKAAAKEKKKAEVEQRFEGDVIDVFKKIKDTPDPPEKYQKWLDEDSE